MHIGHKLTHKHTHTRTYTQLHTQRYSGTNVHNILIHKFTSKSTSCKYNLHMYTTKVNIKII